MSDSEIGPRGRPPQDAVEAELALALQFLRAHPDADGAALLCGLAGVATQALADLRGDRDRAVARMEAMKASTDRDELIDQVEALRAERDTWQQQNEDLQHDRYAIARELKDSRAAYARLDDALIKADADLAALRSRGQALVQRWRTKQAVWEQEFVYKACADELEKNLTRVDSL